MYLYILVGDTARKRAELFHFKSQSPFIPLWELLHHTINHNATSPPPSTEEQPQKQAEGGQDNNKKKEENDNNKPNGNNNNSNSNSNSNSEMSHYMSGVVEVKLNWNQDQATGKILAPNVPARYSILTFSIYLRTFFAPVIGSIYLIVVVFFNLSIY